MQHQRSQIPLCKLLLRHSFNTSASSPKHFPLNALTQRVSDSPPSPKKPNTPDILLNTPTTNSHRFVHPPPSNSPTHFTTLRQFSGGNGGGSDEFDQNEVVDEINLKFAEAREEIEMAMDSKETVYFNEEAECARDAVKEVLDLYEGLLDKLPDNKKAAVQRSMGLKIEQLKAELQQLND